MSFKPAGGFWALLIMLALVSILLFPHKKPYFNNIGVHFGLVECFINYKIYAFLSDGQGRLFPWSTQQLRLSSCLFITLTQEITQCKRIQETLWVHTTASSFRLCFYQLIYFCNFFVIKVLFDVSGYTASLPCSSTWKCRRLHCSAIQRMSLCECWFIL